MAKPIQIATGLSEFIETAGGGGGGSNIGDPVGGSTDESILFINTGILAQDTGLFSYDDTNKRMRIGAASADLISSLNVNAGSSTFIARFSSDDPDATVDCATAATAAVTNYSQFKTRANTSTGVLRDTFQLRCGFADITDASRDGYAYFRQPTGGVNATTMALVAGDVGIGTETPASQLHVYDDAETAIITIESASGNGAANLGLYGSRPVGVADLNLGQINWQWDGNIVAQIRGATGTTTGSDAGDVFIRTAPAGGGVTERLRIISTGEVGIGTDAPSYLLDVIGGDCRVQNGTTGLTPSPQAQTLILEGNTACGMSLLTPNNIASNIYFGSISSNAEARINYSPVQKQLTVGPLWSTGTLNLQGGGNRAVTCLANGNVVIRGTADVENVALNIDTTTGAFLPSRLTTTQRDALIPTNGMIIYNATTNQFNFYENGSWVTK